MGRTAILAGIIFALAGCGSSPVIRVGSKNFTEQVVLGEIIAQHLEHRLSQKIDRKLNLGGTLLAHQALVNGEIDLYPEYSGTALSAVLKQSTAKDPGANDPAAVLTSVRDAYSHQFHVAWLDPLGIDNSFAMVIRGPDARAKHLATLSDAAGAKQAWALGVGYEFEQRSDGMAALDKTYRLQWKGSPQRMDLGLLYKALEQNQVDMIAANATDGLLSTLDLKVLADDQHAFPPYQVCIAVREDDFQKYPGLREALQQLSGKFTNQVMQQLNYRVDGQHQPVAQVAADFLKQAGLQ